MRAAGRTCAWGIAAAALYVITAVTSSHWTGPPARILYDGLAPLAPYRWVRPPPELARDNQPPEPGAGDVPFGPEGLSPLSITAGDGQATVIFGEKTVAATPGESAVTVRLIPLDPATVAAAPSGLRFDSNAYRIDVSYASSGKPVVLRAPATVVLRYATGANGIMRFSGAAWAPLQIRRYDLPQLATAETRTLGTFVTTAPATLPYTQASHWRLYGLLVLLALIAALVIYVTLRSRPRRQARQRRSSPP